jgi:Protein of unknown function (DUF2924)
MAHRVPAGSAPSPATTSAVSHSGLSLQADQLGDLDADTRRVLDRIGAGSSDGIDRIVADLNRSRTGLRPGTLLTREWDGHLQRVMVLADGFSWNGKTYRSLSKVAFCDHRLALERPQVFRPAR